MVNQMSIKSFLACRLPCHCYRRRQLNLMLISIIMAVTILYVESFTPRSNPAMMYPNKKLGNDKSRPIGISDYDTTSRHGGVYFLSRDNENMNTPTDLVDPQGSSSIPSTPTQQPSVTVSTPEFDSLDVMLNKARQRNKFPFLFGRIKATLDGKALPFEQTNFLTRGDVLLLSIAYFVLDAKGFTFGLFFGKATSKSLRNVLPKGIMMATSIQLWPVILAIVFDQFI